MDYTTFLTAPFIFSVILSLSLTPAVRKIAVKYGKVAKPKADRWHKTPTALFGGVAIYLTVIAASVLFITPTDKFLGILAGGTFLFAFGIIDDLKPLKPYTKIIAQIGAAVIAIFFNVKIELFTPLIALPLTVLWIVAVTNAFNLLDNMDGLWQESPLLPPLPWQCSRHYRADGNSAPCPSLSQALRLVF